MFEPVYAARMRRIIAACALLAGCGGPDELSRGELDQVRETVEAYAGALVDRDGEAACATLTQAMRERHGPDCPRGIVRLDEFDEPTRVELERALDDDGSARAIVRYTSGAGLSGGAVALRREGGRWLIDRDLTCLGPSCRP